MIGVGNYPDEYPGRLNALYTSIDVLIFFCDNLITQGHQTDVSALTRLASLYNIAFATNRTTADMILTSPLFNDDNYKMIVPDVIEKYKNRQI